MYESHWDKEKKQPRSKSVMAFGYVQDLISDGIGPMSRKSTN